MTIDRRKFLTRALSTTGAFTTVAGGRLALGAPPPPPSPAPKGAPDLSTWAGVRAEFPLSRDYIHMALMLLTSHPRPVREAIDRHRRGLDENPVAYGMSNFQKQDDAVRAAAADYTGGRPDEIALTGNTTTGLALLYGGLPLRPRQEILATTHDHYVTYEALRLRTLHTGAPVRKIPLYAVPEKATTDEIVGNLVKGIGPRTRAVACTWVHSSTGVKLPIRRFASRDRDPSRSYNAATVSRACVASSTPASRCAFFRVRYAAPAGNVVEAFFVGASAAARARSSTTRTPHS